MRAYVCVCARARVCVCVCVCVLLFARMTFLLSVGCSRLSLLTFRDFNATPDPNNATVSEPETNAFLSGRVRLLLPPPPPPLHPPPLKSVFFFPAKTYIYHVF